VIRPLPRADTLRRYRWEHPEWWIIPVVFAAWAVLSVAALDLIGADGHSIAGSGVHVGHASSESPIETQAVDLESGLSWWAFMVMAMMLPLAGPEARRLAHRSLAGRRQRTVVLHLGGFVGVWILVGATAMAVIAVLRVPVLGAAVLLMLAAAWHVTTIRRRALQRCGAGQLPAVRGLRADFDCLRGGADSAVRCVVTCGLPMLSMVALHSLPVMAALTLLGINERREGPNAERRVARPAEALGIAGVALIVAANG